MKLASVRFVVRDIATMASFYARITEGEAQFLAPVFAEIVTRGATIALGTAQTVALFKEGSAEPAANRTAIIELQVDDVDATFARVSTFAEVVHEPKVMPWGNRTAQVRDPEGNLVSFYTPVTDAARARFDR
ncbi:VOC family protein [Luteibacter sp. PPL201]|uniref:VOC family protein n=1 Tax=Luteibacter sahnii TaxID=3021977 RepID=A0ABT6B9P6_9GAMM